MKLIRKNYANLACLLVILALVSMGCAGKVVKPDGTEVQVSTERALFFALERAVSTAEMAKVAVETLRDAGLITAEQFTKFDQIKLKFKAALKVANEAAKKWALMKPSPEKAGAYAEADRALAAAGEVLKNLEFLVETFKAKK